MNLLECQSLSKYYGAHAALQDVDLVLPRGRIIGLLGKNGAGKTTLLKLCNDLLTPTHGKILFEGEPLGVRSKAGIAYLPERTYLDKTMTVEKVLGYFSAFYQNFDAQKARMLLRDLDLREDARISEMSKGMQEKLQLILVMSRRAKLYMLDEPLGGVDPATRDYILDTILQNFEDGASVLISTHLIGDIERILDDVVILEKGRVAEAASADALREQEGGSIDEWFRRRFRC